MLLALLVSSSAPAATHPEPLVVGSKNFEESRLLAEMFAQLIEARAGIPVERRLNLAGTQVCFEALRTGAIDLYPEYTGTGLASILAETGATGDGSAAVTLARVRREFLARWNLHWLAPLGFENAYEIAVPRALAERHGLRTLSDLARISGGLDAGFGYEFVARPDGLPGLAETYGLAFASVRRLQQALKYGAVASGDVQVLDVYTTDGRLLTHDLVVLEDDRGFFPPYDAAPLVSGAALERYPQMAGALALLAGSLDRERMRQLNRRLQEDGDEPAAVARDTLVELGLVAPPAGGEPAPSGRARDSFAGYLWRNRGALARHTGEHLALSGAGLALGALVAIPLALALERRRALAEATVRAVAVTQTIPSLALLAFTIPFLGVGRVPAVVALWVYSLFPMLRNTFTGVRDADPDAVEAATALGMTARQVLLRVRLPLSAPVIMAGVRTAAVLTVGTATLAAFVGAGGLGEPIVTGLQLADTRRILSGALPAALLAILVDRLLAGVERLVTPKGVFR